MKSILEAAVEQLSEWPDGAETITVTNGKFEAYQKTDGGFSVWQLEGEFHGLHGCEVIHREQWEYAKRMHNSLSVKASSPLNEYRFDEPALKFAQKIMEYRATAAAEAWPDGRLLAAIQCLVIDAMKWAAPSILPIGELLQRLRDQTGEEWVSASDAAVPDDVQRDAARWRALLGSARIRILGSAGFQQMDDPRWRSHPDYRHFGMEIWTHHPDWPADKNQYGIEILTKYADQMRTLLGDSPAPGGDDA